MLERLPKRLFPLRQVTSAFRYMAQARHTGKIVVVHPGWSGIRKDGTYLITGGTGALGRAFAEYLADRGAGQVVVAGRHLPADGTFASLKSSGTVVTAVAADVTDPRQVAGLVDRIGREMPPLRGVLHAAGVIRDGLLAGQDWSNCQAVLGAKALGAWNLHTATAALPLDFFVMFSSIASIFGGSGQGAYAAANSFLDSLAHLRRARGLPATSINWGPWADAGMAAAGAVERRSAAYGLTPLSRERALKAFEQVLFTGITQAAVVDAAWDTFAVQHGSGTSSRLLNELASSQTQPAPAKRASLLEILRNTPAHKRRAALEHHVLEQSMRVLGLAPDRRIDPRQPLADFGLDSLMAVELRNHLARSMEQELPATLLFDYPVIEELVNYLVVLLPGDVPVAVGMPAGAKPRVVPAPAGRSGPSLLDAIEQLADEDVDRLFRVKDHHPHA